MAGSVGTDSSGSVNVELNVVPFIDLMSCLTAFLLVTAVWSSYAQIPIQPKGLQRPGIEHGIEEPELTVSVLLTKHDIWVGLTTGDRAQIRSPSGGYDWQAFATVLAEYRGIPDMEFRPSPGGIEIAAEDEITYQQVVNAMDYAIAANFRDVDYREPEALSVRFRE